MDYVYLLFLIIGGLLIYVGKRLLAKSSWIDLIAIFLLFIIFWVAMSIGISFVIRVFEDNPPCWNEGLVLLLGWVLSLLALGGVVSFSNKIPYRKAFLAVVPVTLGFGLLFSPLLFDVFSPHTGRARELAKRAVCKTRLKGLGTAMNLYHDAYKVYPPSPSELIEEGYASSKNFQCPSDTHKREMSYYYLPPLETDEGATFIMCDLKGNHENMRYVLLKDGTVKEFTEEEFQNELKQPYNVHFAEALKKAERP